MSNARSHARAWERAFSFPARREVRRTPGISCEAVPAFTLAARAQDGTLWARSGAVLSFVSFIPLFGGPACPAIVRYAVAGRHGSSRP